MTPATILEHDGVEQSVIEWALDYGLTPEIILARLARGVDAATAITQPMTVSHRGQQLAWYHPMQGSPAPAPALITLDGPRKKREGLISATYNFAGKTLTVPEWAAATGLNRSALYHRLSAGWTIERALTVPIRGRLGSPGVSPNLSAFEGTGAGSTAQETPNITFSGNDA